MATVYGDLIYVPMHGTLAEWEESNPILLEGQEGIATDGGPTYYKKVGDGVTAWNDLEWKTGPKGADGVSVERAIITGDGKLRIVLSNGQASDIGKVVGKNGDDGYTPIKGVDYYTEEDKTEIINSVLSKFTDVSEVGL